MFNAGMVVNAKRQNLKAVGSLLNTPKKKKKKFELAVICYLCYDDNTIMPNTKAAQRGKKIHHVSTLSKIVNSDLKRVQTNSIIWSLLPGSSSPNWLHGNARISRPVDRFQKQIIHMINTYPIKAKQIDRNFSVDLDLGTSHIIDSVLCNWSWSFHCKKHDSKYTRKRYKA